MNEKHPLFIKFQFTIVYLKSALAGTFNIFEV